MTDIDWSRLASDLTETLHLASPPLAITFSDAPPDGVPPFDEAMPEALADGRTGRVAAGCVFWMKAADRTFSTVAEDHGNCSVGSVTHGFKALADVAGNSDVAALLDSGWVTMDVVPQIPVVRDKPGAVTYGPLADTPVEPDVVFLRVSGRQLMVLSDAIPGLRIEGKPQCHIVALAKEEHVPAASVGCALSRVRTGMPPTEMTCALPASQLPNIVASIKQHADADATVARYAAEDARRFA
ncbi:MAG TPA: DUF169 domain-containing protein [Acidimicrobiia bacterium]|jgi:uncharacterized protein (DUF169 family)